ncbi:MAG: hypothetical protein CM1200mP4_1190 [Rhodospirillaceae bacterium]|nr:MAG: hypothetical protein CM1200mP4_1190 [Rhodospirillaceae bacterium]
MESCPPNVFLFVTQSSRVVLGSIGTKRCAPAVRVSVEIDVATSCSPNLDSIGAVLSFDDLWRCEENYFLRPYKFGGNPSFGIAENCL